jgi:uncharacterized protein (DUF885 family)
MKTGSSRFEGVLDDYFETLLAEQHPYAATLGLKSGEGRLPHATKEAETRQEQRRQTALRKLDTLSPRDLTAEQQLDRLAFRAWLLRECEDHARRRSALDPDAPDQVMNILLHELMRGDDEPARAARNLRSLLQATPRFLAEAVTLVDRPDPVWRRILQQSAAGAGSLLTAVESFLKQHAPAVGDQDSLAAARRAFARYVDRVNGRPPAPAGSFAVGPETVQRRVRDELGLDYTLGQIEALASAEIGRIEARLQQVCAQFGRGRSARDLIAEARAAWNPPADLLGLYRDETQRLVGALRELKIVSFPPGETLEVKPVPDFMRPLLPTAAYTQPGAFARRQRGIFWVNDLSVTQTTAAEKRAERQQHFGVALTCAHEAYPGHHLQFATANRHPRRWRRLFARAVFYEGWTLWCEQMMVDLRLDRSPWLRVQQLRDALWRCHRILVDLRLQTRRYTYDQAVRHLVRHVGFTRARAQADVNWYCGAPTVPMSYWLGRLENDRLHRRLVTGRGWSLRQFNDWLLNFGTLPQSWLEKYALD